MAKKRKKVAVKRIERGVTVEGPIAEVTEALGEAVEQAKAPAPEWERQPLLEKMVAELVEKYHQHLAHATILVLGKPKATRSKGKVNVAKAKRATPAIRALLQDALGVEVHYLIEVGMDAWERATAKQKRAILDHELHHFTGLEVSESGKETWGMRGHDVEEFTVVVRRHGAYHADLELFVAEVRQLKLLGVE